MYESSERAIAVSGLVSTARVEIELSHLNFNSRDFSMKTSLVSFKRGSSSWTVSCANLVDLALIGSSFVFKIQIS